jgi:hypothetical protein
MPTTREPAIVSRIARREIVPSSTTRNVSCVLAVINSLWLLIGGIGIMLWLDLQTSDRRSAVNVLVGRWPIGLFILVGVLLLICYIAVADGRRVWGYPIVPWYVTILYNLLIAALMWWFTLTAAFWPTILLALWATIMIAVAGCGNATQDVRRSHRQKELLQPDGAH